MVRTSDSRGSTGQVTSILWQRMEVGAELAHMAQAPHVILKHFLLQILQKRVNQARV